jgi:transcriptional accessory protein Tex/SPT6
VTRWRKRIVQHREANGAFTSRKDLLKVSGLGPRAFEQAAGFLRVRGASTRSTARRCTRSATSWWSASRRIWACR